MRLIITILLANSLFGQYTIENFVGRLGPLSGTPALETAIDSTGVLQGPTGNILYLSPYQLVEILPSRVIGRIWGIDQLRFDLADGGDRDYWIIAGSVDADGNIYLLDWLYSRLLRIGSDGSISAIVFPSLKAGLSRE